MISSTRTLNGIQPLGGIFFIIAVYVTAFVNDIFEVFLRAWGKFGYTDRNIDGQRDVIILIAM